MHYSLCHLFFYRSGDPRDLHVLTPSFPTRRSSFLRRQCPNCGARFTTFERVQLRELTVVKSTGQREPFDRDKLARSMQISLRKRPVDADRLARVVNGIVRRLESSCESEIPTAYRKSVQYGPGVP